MNDELRGLTDERLVERVQRDPGGPDARAAASELLGRHQRRVYLWCRRYVREHEQAVDLAQEVLLSAYRGLAGFESRARFTSWLFAITRNRCLKAVAAPRLLLDESEEALEVPDPRVSPAEAYEEREDEERLRRLLAEHLDEQEREALWLRCFERMAVDDITRVMRLDSATGARGLLQRARRRLRAVLAREEEQA